jgi:hypothetical protein
MNSKEITIAKTLNIYDILASYGSQPTRCTGNRLVYSSPFTNEKTPSFMVDIRKNLFYDFSSNNGGDSIKLIMLLEGVSFIDAVNKANKLDKNSFNDFNFDLKPIEKESKLKITEIKEIENTSLINYLSSRRIDLELARMWVKEVHYSIREKMYYAIGFKNDSGGYELRNGLSFKGKTKNGITTVKGVSDKGLDEDSSIFEGFFDFLSALCYYKLGMPSHKAYVLNSLVNLDSIIPDLSKSKKVYSYLDNDRAGVLASKTLVNKGLNVKNMSVEIYPGFKDFNEFWVG